MAHLTSFTVENFKRFEHFEMNNIGQFNLIVGDNNVGKTSVLEALLVDKSAAVTRYNLLKVLTEYRGIEHPRETYLRSFIRRGAWLQADTVISYDEGGTLMLLPEKDMGYVWSYNGFISDFDLSNDKTIKFDGTLRFDGTGIVHVPLIPFLLGHDKDLALIYSSYVQQDKKIKKIVLETMRSIVPNIEEIEINVAMAEEPILVIWQSNIREPMPLATFGDGTLKFLRIMLNLFIHSNQRLMIDEIDAGIHVSRLRKFFKSIFKIATDNNVQLFATTHNLECLQVFKEVLEEPEMVQYQEKVRCFTLIDSKVTQRVEAVCSAFAQFENAIETNTEIRGGAVV